jgi:TetR/AcrR family transcriptional regulator
MADNDARGKLIAEATPLFAEKGYHGVSIREIAGIAGANVSMISYYFGGKEGLYAAVLGEQFSALKKVADIAQSDADPLQKFEEYVRETVARYRRNPHLLRFYTAELTNPTPCFATIVKPAIQEVIHYLEHFFAAGVARRQFREGLDPTDAALVLAGMINFYFLLEPATKELLADPAEQDEKLTRHIMDIFTKGVVR